MLVFRALSPFVRAGAAVSWVRSHAASSCSPLTRKMLLLSRPPSRETCPLPPCEVVRTFRVVPRGASAFVSRRWVCPSSPSMRLLLCASVSRRRALLNWLALRMRVTPTAPLPRLCCGRSDGIGGGLPHRLRAASSRPRLRRPVHNTAEAAGLCRLPSKTWRCDGVSLNCRCSAVLF